MTKKEEKYLEHKIGLIRAVVVGTLAGTYMFGMQDNTRSEGEKVQDSTKNAMDMIERDVRNVYQYGKHQNKTKKAD